MNKIKSRFTNHDYDINNVVRIVKYWQAAFYWENGLEPIDIYPSKDIKTGEPIIVFIFDREASQALFYAWRNHSQERSARSGG